MLELKNIEKSYGKHKALYDVNIKFEAGIYGLLGPNGAGKSTMMNIIADVMEPTEGKVLYNDVDIKELNDRYRLNIGYLPQKVGYYGDFTAEKTLEYFAVLRGVKKADIREKIEEVLEIVNLSDNARDKVKTFSGGMKQRMGIAVTLIANPEILIFDEPTVGLDPKERKNFREFIRKLAKEKTIILSTHIVSDISDIADYVILLKQGKIVGMEKTENVGRMVLEHEKQKNIIEDENKHVNHNTDKNIVNSTDEAAGNRILTLEDVYMHYFGE